MYTKTSVCASDPAAEYFTLLLQSNSRTPINIRVLDVIGRVVKRFGYLTANGLLYLGRYYRLGVYFVEAQQAKKDHIIGEATRLRVFSSYADQAVLFGYLRLQSLHTQHADGFGAVQKIPSSHYIIFQ